MAWKHSHRPVRSWYDCMFVAWDWEFEWCEHSWTHFILFCAKRMTCLSKRPALLVFTSLCTTNFRCCLQSKAQNCNSNNTRNIIWSANTYLEMSIVVKLASYFQLSYPPVYLFSIVLSWLFRKEPTITLSFSFYHKHCKNCQNYPPRIVDKVLKMTSSGCQKDRTEAF